VNLLWKPATEEIKERKTKERLFLQLRRALDDRRIIRMDL
jgi:hypothetical protein